MERARHIAVVTGTRAEYGLLEPVMQAIATHAGLALHVITTGTHLITASHRDITFPIAARVRMQRMGEAGRVHDAASLGRGITGLTRVFAGINPDVVLVLGDRIEAFAAGSAAAVGGLCVAHVHGGDRAEGVADESMRHAISKLAHLHFAATAQSRRRLIRMGELPEWVFNVGSPAIDALRTIEPADTGPEVIVLQHPIGDDDATEAQRMRVTLEATRAYRPLVLMPNHDPGRDGIVQAIRSAGVDAVDHLPRQRFVALLKRARVIVGNSSAGLIEAAACRTACVNVGPRQGGREKPASVIDCAYGFKPARAALRAALSLDLRTMRHPYGPGNAGTRIASLLASLDLARVPMRKHNRY